MRFRELAQRALGPNDRVLVLGATGWFGTVTVDIALEAGAKVLAISGSARTCEIEHRVIQTHVWSEELITAFNPTVVVDAAFLTREKLVPGEEEKYLGTNRSLMANAYKCFELTSIRAFIGFSSGAALTEPAKPYGSLKREYEETLELLSRRYRVNTVVARAWSVSGPYVAKRSSFAFTDLIDQALSTGQISLKSTGKVHRRYCSIQDFITLCFAVSATDSFSVVDSGGDLVEIGDLAKQIMTIAGIQGQPIRRFDLSTPSNDYFADAIGWQSLVNRFGLEPVSLPDQIRHGINERLARPN